jgi:ribosome-binding protein aMBF1 (putative translation factor)
LFGWRFNLGPNIYTTAGTAGDVCLNRSTVPHPSRRLQAREGRTRGPRLRGFSPSLRAGQALPEHPVTPIRPRRVEYEALAPEFEISAELVKARLRAGLSQAELAARMGASQSTIARLESGQTLPSTKTLLRYAQATGSKFHVRLSAA